MTQGFMSATASNKNRRIGMLGATCTAALLTVQPMLMPLAVRADNGNGDNGGYSNSVNGAQGRIVAGTLVKVHLLDPISSASAHVGDRFRVAVASDDTSGLPSGTVFFGQITQVTPGTPNSAGSVALQLALPRGSYAFDQYDNGSSNSGYNGNNAPSPNTNGNYNHNDTDNGNGPDSYNAAPGTPAAASADSGPNPSDNGPGSNGPNPNYNNSGPSGNYSNSNGPYNANGGYPSGAPGALTISNDASASFSGHSPKGAGHTAGIAAAAGALLGFSRKRKLGDAIEGGALGGVGGAAYDQTQKRGASDVSFNRGDEIAVRLNRPMSVRTIVVPADNG